MDIYVKNLTNEEKDWGTGRTFLPNEEFLIPTIKPNLLCLYSENNLFLSILNSEAQIGDGLTYFTDLNYQINYLKGKITPSVSVEEIPQPYAFAKKTLADGKKLYRRKHGVRQNCPANSETSIQFVVPYAHCKIDEVEVINCSGNDNVDLKVLDDESGTYSTVPNYCLNQFGFNVSVSDLYYADSSNYDADLYQNMVLEVIFKNNDAEAKNIGINFVLHEVVTV